MNNKFDIVVKNGTVIDTSQGIHEHNDIAITHGRIADLRKGINVDMAKYVIDASGMIVTPGLIDLHVHCSNNITYLAIDPETACLAKGCTTVLDAGSTGELNFNGFKKYVIDTSKTRIYALLNIESLGMIEFAKANQKWPELIAGQDMMFINTEGTCKIINQNRKVILGIKWAHHGVEGLALARKAADEAKCIIMAENHHQPECLKYLKKGDVVTHLYHSLRKQNDGLIDTDGKIQPDFYDAKKRGVFFDLGHGARSFDWEVAENALRQGIVPDTLSSDLHVENVKGPVYDLPTTMSKLLLLGMSLDEVIEASTFTPAKVIDKNNMIGTLRIGTCADIAIFKLRKGKFHFVDMKGEVRIGRWKLMIKRVIRQGRIIV